jgi:hypothetical protein
MMADIRKIRPVPATGSGSERRDRAQRQNEKPSARARSTRAAASRLNQSSGRDVNEAMVLITIRSSSTL